MKRLLVTLLLTLAGIASAGSLTTDAVAGAGFNDLSETEKAAIIKDIADRKAASSRATQAQLFAEKTTPEKVNEWLDVGSRIGQGMAGAAREMGVAVNEFAKSPVGMWTIALITWKFIGGVMMHAFGAMVIWVFGFGFIWWSTRKYGVMVISYDPERTDLLGRSRILSKRRDGIDGDMLGGILFCGFVVMVAGLIAMFTY